MISRTSGSRLAILAMLPLCILALGARVPTTQEDFHVPGTEHGEVDISVITTSDNCRGCHGDYDPGIDLYSAWKGSMMSMAAVDPLFYAQLTTANQDTSEAGYYCLRCHAPFGIASGHTIPTDGSALDDMDRDGVTCHICHALTDPIYKPGVSPERDLAVLAGTADLPQYYGNGAFVLDPTFTMRGPLDNIYAAHDSVFSPIHESGNHCGTCHDVGNTQVSRQPDGTWRYNALNAPAPDPNPRMQFPIQSTYTEWKLSLFPGEGVDMSGRFGDPDEPVIHDCQQCHMPDVVGQACYFGPVRDDLPLHAFAGGGFTMLGVIAAQDPLPQQVDLDAIARGRDRALSMLQRATSFEAVQSGGALRVRTTNETAHKLPTGHSEGRRAWVNVRFYAQNGSLLREYGRYDAAQALLDEATTRVYEILVGLSPYASMVTGLPPGRTSHMTLADTILKDNRIPPRGFNNAAFEAGGAPVVAHWYPDGQYWDDAWFTIPQGAARFEARLNYQVLPRQYVEELRDANVTDDRGQILHDLWIATGKDSPVLMAQAQHSLAAFLVGDIDGDCKVSGRDQQLLKASLGLDWTQPGFEPRADLDGNHVVDGADQRALKARVGSFCRASTVSAPTPTRHVSTDQ